MPWQEMSMKWSKNSAFAAVVADAPHYYHLNGNGQESDASRRKDDGSRQGHEQHCLGSDPKRSDCNMHHRSITRRCGNRLLCPNVPLFESNRSFSIERKNPKSGDDVRFGTCAIGLQELSLLRTLNFDE